MRKSTTDFYVDRSHIRLLFRGNQCRVAESKVTELKELIPTEEQLAVVEAAKRGESFIVEAGAGAAKTTTLKMLAAKLPLGASVLAVAFNKRIVNDLTEALPSDTTVKTLNALGHGAWMKQRGGRLEVDGKKISRLVTMVLKERAPSVYAKDEDGSCWAAVRDFVQDLRWNSYVPAGMLQKPIYTGLDDPEEIIEEFQLTHDWPTALMSVELMMTLADQVLRVSIMEGFNKLIDYDDQIYLTTSFFCPYPKFDVVMVDEAQDLSPQNHQQLLLCKPKQLIAVGDRRQAIYAFRGADTDSIDNLREKAKVKLNLDMGSYRLATSFRCPKLVVERQHAHYPEFTAFEGNPDGEVKNLDKWSVEDIPANAAIICRNNAPLVAAAFLLLRQRKGFKFFGQDMAKNLKGLIKKVAGFTGKDLRVGDKAIPSEKILDSLGVWFERERTVLVDSGRDHLVAGLTDRKECARMILLESKTLGEAMELSDQIFENAGDLVLTSGHRSKGFEWNWVMHLDPFRLPSKYAVEAAKRGAPSQMRQENNLRYVIETRTKFTLVLAKLESNADARAIEGDE